MKIAVTGGSGFIGTRLVRLLIESDHDVRIFDKRPSATFPDKCMVGDVRDMNAFEEGLEGANAVYHLAAEHRDDVRPISLYDDVNVGGAENLCQVARKKDVTRIIFTSSVAVYGFAPLGTDESGTFNPFNDYGRTKMEAEAILKEWQREDQERRTLVIVRPTVVFGERNRGNVYNLLRQMASGRFVMVGNGRNAKSMAYVENAAAFLRHSLTFGPGVHIYNYIDKPDFDMNALVETVSGMLGRKGSARIRLPYSAGMAVGKAFDFVALLSRRTFPVSAIRVKKFCSNTMFNTSVGTTGFKAPVSILDGLQRTIRYEFLERHDEPVFHTE